MNKVNITIDGKELSCQEGAYILDVARANDIFIPAICYLTRCSPTLACRLCMVDNDGKTVYACNAKAKEGMVINTATEAIEKERREIMEVYDLNHPLQCGVCDQSGECELQNYTLEMGVETQSFSIQDTARPTKHWGFINYDAGLCIVCERCVTVCKDMIGSNYLKTVPRGGEQVAKELKDTLSKDLFAMWQKMQKSIIGTDEANASCIDCGECIAVCPVGALASSDFTYTSNAWELEKIASSCTHCSVACHLYYEVKHASVENSDKKIYRVTNEFHYQSLCGAGRFGFDFENRVEEKDSNEFLNTIKAFKKADTISFSSFITNEEALILQRLKEKYGYKLVNNDALNFQNFLSNFSKASGRSLYSGAVDDVRRAGISIVVGSFLKSEAPVLKYALNNALKTNKSSALYFHTLEDEHIASLSKNISTNRYKVGSEELLLYLLADILIDDDKKPDSLKTYLSSMKERRVKQVEESVKEKVKVLEEKDGEQVEVEKTVTKTVTKDVEFTYSFLCERLGFGGEAYDDLLSTTKSPLPKTLILGSDLYAHPRAANIAKLAGLIDARSEFSVILIPTHTNTLGVSLICDLDSNKGEFVIGYNSEGDYKLSSLSSSSKDLDMPSLNQQEGTFTNINKKVVPINPALPYRGYELNDIAQELGLTNKNTIDYTKELPLNKGFKNIEFDSLNNRFLNDGSEDRGYELNIEDVDSHIDIESPKELEEYNGTIVYLSNPTLQFSMFTNECGQLSCEPKFLLSPSLATTLGAEEGDSVEISASGSTIKMAITIEPSIKNDAVIVPKFVSNAHINAFFGEKVYINAEVRKA